MPKFLEVTDTEAARAAIGSTTVGDSLFTATDAATARAAISSGPYISVADFDADPTGVADSATAFQNAIDAAEAMSAPRPMVFIPGGTYMLGAGLVISQHSVGLVGADGEHSVQLNYTGTDTNAITSTAAGAVKLANFILEDTGGFGTNGIVFNYTAASTTNYRNVVHTVQIRSFSGNGLVFSGCEAGQFESVVALNCGIGFYAAVNPSGGGNALNNHFNRCRAQSSTSYGWQIGYVDGSLFTNCQALVGGDGTAANVQFIVQGTCRGNTILMLDTENPTASPNKGIGLQASGNEHVISMASYGLDIGVRLSYATGCTVLQGKYSSVTTPVKVDVGSTKCVVLDPAITVSDLSGSNTHHIVDLTGLRASTLSDINGKASMVLGATASAVNYLTFTNAAAGGSPSIAASGSDASINLDLTPKGAGTNVRINGVPVVTTTSSVTMTNKALTSPKITSGNAPASAGATGTAGQIEWDSDYFYICTAANTWKRAAIATW